MSVRAIPTLLKVGFAEAAAYRAEMVVWVLSTTMPLVMMLLWTSIAEVSPVQGAAGAQWGSSAFVGYFLCVFIVRQLVSAWAAWEINYEVRQGTLALRLLRPLHPLIHYACSNLAYLPLRTLVTLPVAIFLVVTHREALSGDWRHWLLFPVAVLGAWLINFLVNVSAGALAFTVESSLRVMDLWLALFFVFSGYLVPLEFFPAWLREVADWLPWRYVLALPVELMTGRAPFEVALGLLARQLAWVLGLGTVAAVLWGRGVTKFQAFGG
ncbi:MAG: ABC-2 family transporter protein [Myxococcaceae bacterium]|nr:ABC-2 family transporter protein [Myxococcaceae bacterium]